jgi:RNA polymerase sigma factor (sigma-70 family)
MSEDQLIAEFQRTRSEDAFAALVRRHVDLVFAAALRQVGDRGMAEEISQNVFAALARKASSIGRHKTIAGWLYHATLNEARLRVRSELRRQRREQRAADLQVEQLTGDSIWKPLVPLLDEGLQSMDEPDRMAVLLHCLEGRPFREVGEALGVGEDAARKRVDRALDRLTSFFRGHGFAVPAVTAGVPLFVLATQAAPAGLAEAIVPVAMAGVTTSTTSGLIMASTKVKIGVAAVAVAAVTTPLVVVHRSESRLVAENQALRRQMQEMAAETARRSNLTAQASHAGQWSDPQRSELMRLRGEVGMLRRQIQRVGAATQAAPAARLDPGVAQAPGAVASSNVLPRESWSFAGYATPEAALQSIAWAASKGDVRTFVGSLTEEGRAQFDKETQGKSDSEVTGMLTNLMNETHALRLDQKKVSGDGKVTFVLSYREQNDGAATMRDEQLITLVQVDGEWKMSGE